MTDPTPLPWCKACAAPLLTSGVCAFCGEGDVAEAPAPALLCAACRRPLEVAPAVAKTHGELVQENARLSRDLATVHALADANGAELLRRTGEGERLREALRGLAEACKYLGSLLSPGGRMTRAAWDALSRIRAALPAAEEVLR